ncbi:MAG: hypothetical protein ACI841_001976 [Planctomycetota bacterium]|jgi:hypothetical protein
MRTTESIRIFHPIAKLVLATLLGAAALPLQAFGQTCAPSFLGSWASPGDALSVTVVGNTVYVADRQQGMHIVDASDPSTPVLLGTYNAPGGDPDGIFYYDIAVDGSTAYAINGSYGLVVIDVGDPTAPALLSELPFSGSSRSLVLDGATAYVAGRTAGLHIIDVSDPLAPALLGTLPSSDAWDVAIVGNVAYVADRLDGLLAIDVSDPTFPTLLSATATVGRSRGVAARDTTVYVGSNITGGGDGELLIFDVANPAAPILVGTQVVPETAFKLQVVGNTAYVGQNVTDGEVQIIDVSDPSTPALLGVVDPVGAPGQPGPRVVTVVGTIAYAADDLGFQIFEVGSCHDTDLDGLLDSEEITLGTDPSNPDTDDDGLTDGDEVNLHFTDPLDARPEPDCAADQLTEIGIQAQVSFSGAGSTDREDDLSATPLTYDWDIVDAATLATVLTTSGVAITESLGYGDYVVTLTVTDSAGASESCSTDLHLNPAVLSVFDCEKMEIKFAVDEGETPGAGDRDRFKLSGEIALPMGVDYSELQAVAVAMVNVAGTDFLGVGAAPVIFEVNGGHNEHWKYRDDDAIHGVTKFDIDWKGARFKYDESVVPVKFESEVIMSTETVLIMEYMMDDAGGAFTVDINGTLLEVDADGVVTSGDLPAGAIEVEKTGKKVALTLPFPLLESSTVIFGGAIGGTVMAADHYTNSLGRFKIEAEAPALSSGAGTVPRTAGAVIGVGGPLYPGSCGAGPDDLDVSGKKWKLQN